MNWSVLCMEKYTHGLYITLQRDVDFTSMLNMSNMSMLKYNYHANQVYCFKGFQPIIQEIAVNNQLKKNASFNPIVYCSPLTFRIIGMKIQKYGRFWPFWMTDRIRFCNDDWPHKWLFWNVWKDCLFVDW